jgi:mRNA deadenylase 3'-5' endonuclease subunit Ccr4
VDYIKDSRGWIGLIDSDYIFQINSQFLSIKEKNENKKLDEEIKSKKMKNL